MDYHITLTAEQFESLYELLNDTVQRNEHDAAALGILLGDAARDLAQERLDAAQNAAELVGLLAQYQGGEH